MADIEDIDSWYEEQKQTIMEEYLLQIEKGKNRKKAEEKYEKKMQETIKRYYTLMDGKLDGKKSSWHRAISSIKERIMMIRK